MSKKIHKINLKCKNSTYKNILQEIYNMISERKKNPIEKSYTNYLLEQGIDKICKKVGEEATETVIAAKNSSKDELISEICDLSYHVLVLMYIKDIKLADVRQKLIERHRIQGNKKSFHKRGDY